MVYSDDPITDFYRFDAEQEAKLDKLPRCSECDQPIQDEFCFEINGELICDSCMHDNHRKCVDDFMEATFT